MNHFAAATRRQGSQWLALARYVHRGDFWPVMEGDGPKLFNTHQDARIAALEAVLKHVNGTMVASGERVSAARCKAETLFVKGRKIEVEVKHGKRA